MMDERHSAILSMVITARDGRPQWMSLWQELAEIFLPNRADFTAERMAGEERSDNLWDNGPQLAARSLTSTVEAMMRPPGKTFLKAKAKKTNLNSIDAVRAWLYAVTNITYDALYDPRVNASKVLSEVDTDLVVFGTGICDVGWNQANRHLKLKAESLAHTVLFAGADGNPNGSATFSKPTLRQIVEEFGEDKLTDKMREAYQGPKPKLDEPFEIVKVCIPNKDYGAFGKKAKHPYMSLWFSVGCKELIDEGGYFEFPKVCPRWDTLSNEVYGRSPAMVALPDARVVHSMALTFLEAGEMALRPPTWSFADMIAGDLQLRASGHTIINQTGYQGAGAPIQALQLGVFPDKIFDVWQKKGEAVAAAFFRDVMELPSARDARMTATEISARMDQFLRQAAPVFARVEHTYNAPLINRIFNILMRENMYPPPPEEMYEQEVEFEYESPLKTARDKAEAMKVVEGLSMVMPMIEAEAKLKGPGAQLLDNIDLDVTLRHILMKADLPPMILTPIEKMMADRDARNKKLEMAQQAEMASKAAPAAARLLDAAGNAKQTGLLGFDQPLPIPTLGMTSGESADAEMQALNEQYAQYEDVA